MGVDVDTFGMVGSNGGDVGGQADVGQVSWALVACVVLVITLR